MGEILKERIEVPRGLLWLFGGVTPLSILIAVFVSAAWKSDIENKVLKNSVDIKAHVDNYKQHYDYYNTSKDFIPRSELQIKFEIINEKLDQLLEKNK